MARNSGLKKIRNTIGRTNNGHTPLAAILVSFIPGFLTFLAVKATSDAFQEVDFVIFSMLLLADDFE